MKPTPFCKILIDTEYANCMLALPNNVHDRLYAFYGHSAGKANILSVFLIDNIRMYIVNFGDIAIEEINNDFLYVDFVKRHDDFVRR